MANAFPVAADTEWLRDQIRPTMTDTFSIMVLTLGSDGGNGLEENYAVIDGETENLPGALHLDQGFNPAGRVEETDQFEGGSRFMLILERGVHRDKIVPYMDDPVHECRIIHDQTGDEFEVLQLESPLTEEVMARFRLYKRETGVRP